MYVIILVFFLVINIVENYLMIGDMKHCHGYLLLLITFYIDHVALFHIILSTVPEIVNNLCWTGCMGLRENIHFQ